MFVFLVAGVFMLAPGDSSLSEGEFYTDYYYVFLLIIIFTIVIVGIFVWLWARGPVNKWKKK